MKSFRYCAYNQSRECILGLEVDAADFSEAILADRIPELTPNSGAGLWMVPFRGIPESEISIPLDLVYLDENCRVIDVVESFPTDRISSSSRPAASVLALPARSIRSSLTQPGDQLVVASTEEIQRRFRQLPEQPASMLFQKERIWTRGPAVPEAPAKNEPETAKSGSRKALFGPGAKPRKKKSWLERFLSPDPPDPRQAPRKTVPGLFAYYWTGATPEAHAIRDISSTGLYIITEERWYPGTVVRMTLTSTSSNGFGEERSIALQAKAVRWGNDGVGLQFLVRNPGAANYDVEGADQKQLDEFLQFMTVVPE